MANGKAMTAKVVSLADRKRELEPHMQGRALCLDCHYGWQAVTPTGTVWMFCPKCGLERGRFVAHTEIESGHHWTCRCGCDLFYVTPTAFYCPNCGAEQKM